MKTPAEAEWYLHPQFDNQSANYYCYVTGTDAKNGEGIIRGPFIEGEGFFDISLFAARQLADLIGWVDPKESVKQSKAKKATEADLKKTRDDLEDALELNTMLTRQNAALTYEVESREAEILRLKGSFDD